MLANTVKNKIYAQLKNNHKLTETCMSFREKASSFVVAKGEACEINYRSLLLQEFRETPDVVAGYMIARFHYMIVKQGAVIIPIAVSSPPLPNQYKEENNKILQSIAEPFRAIFGGEPWGQDGSLEWDSDNDAAPDDSVFNNAPKPSVIRYPLEVGYCSILTLWLRFQETGGWVRWPYGSSFLYLFVAPDKLITGGYAEKEARLEAAIKAKLQEPCQLSLFDLPH